MYLRWHKKKGVTEGRNFHPYLYSRAVEVGDRAENSILSKVSLGFPLLQPEPKKYFLIKPYSQKFSLLLRPEWGNFPVEFKNFPLMVTPEEMDCVFLQNKFPPHFYVSIWLHKRKNFINLRIYDKYASQVAQKLRKLGFLFSKKTYRWEKGGRYGRFWRKKWEN